jgi:hypothetical protein
MNKNKNQSEKASAPETRKRSVRKISGLAPLSEQPEAVRAGHESDRLADIIVEAVTTPDFNERAVTSAGQNVRGKRIEEARKFGTILSPPAAAAQPQPDAQPQEGGAWFSDEAISAQADITDELEQCQAELERVTAQRDEYFAFVKDYFDVADCGDGGEHDEVYESWPMLALHSA